MFVVLVSVILVEDAPVTDLRPIFGSFDVAELEKERSVGESMIDGESGGSMNGVED